MRKPIHLLATALTVMTSVSFAAAPPAFTFECNATASSTNPQDYFPGLYKVSWTGKTLAVSDYFGIDREFPIHTATDFTDDPNAIGLTVYAFMPSLEDEPKKPDRSVRYRVILWENEPPKDNAPALIKSYPHSISFTEFTMSQSGFVISDDTTKAIFCSLSGALAARINE
ncbi:hypothetical protein [Achromobacter animicus]|uniref:hypothetical protein n=1 Tax=Achromobacter animicus TaxID=1389935 RepID=UPI0028AD070D|nr:hypothetical protein [Achromobacter animicus]